MKRKIDFRAYHTNFQGDTYDACARCGGRCEKLKIAALLPGEKEYMADVLEFDLGEFENRFLDRLDTPFGSVDVLKLKDGCPFLDSGYHCTASKAKPVLCDSYPLVFSLRGRKVTFDLDRRDCPMVKWPEYRKAVEAFIEKGVPALKALRAPLSWWRMVALFDEFDFDYGKIETELRRQPGYQFFCLEDVLEFVCNGYEQAGCRYLY
jgi:Fe-S-cluster containining protein